ncbi:anti-FecI sigma factor, FecR [Niastella koreensis GR20-10]|uniref:Anti-FecI sigma factor, FecR n=2 Tax=Niastella koreensis TaxID=354356 RepID=G8T9M4_NIAKG|nr:FecR domain-containing protein [Niastella koreensis]AEW00217.1 anti-FecI sigma factor, FecR [Niastella koreensis GR20-10]
MNDVEQLIIDKLTGQIGEEDDLRLEELIAQHQEVEQLWQQMQQVYAMRKAVSFDQSFNMEHAWEALQQKVNMVQPVHEPVTDTVAFPIRNNNTHWLRYSIAAAVAGIILVSLFFLIGSNRSKITVSKGILIKLANGNVVHTSTQDSLARWMGEVRKAKIDPSALNTVMVPAGKRYNFQMSDGSKVWMNSISTLQFPILFTEPTRNLELKGEAYFKVAHQATQPFTVQVNGLTVTALGTEFNIKSYDKEATYISLVTGSVSVQNAKGERIILLPGEWVVAENRNSPLRKELYDETAALGWMQGVYFFTNEKLQQIAVVAERWLDIDIELKDPSLAGIHFTGALDRNKPLSHFFSMLASSGDIRYEVRGSKVFVYRK